MMVGRDQTTAAAQAQRDPEPPSSARATPMTEIVFGMDHPALNSAENEYFKEGYNTIADGRYLKLKPQEIGTNSAVHKDHHRNSLEFDNFEPPRFEEGVTEATTQKFYQALNDSTVGQRITAQQLKPLTDCYNQQLAGDALIQAITLSVMNNKSYENFAASPAKKDYRARYYFGADTKSYIATEYNQAFLQLQALNGRRLIIPGPLHAKLTSEHTEHGFKLISFTTDNPLIAVLTLSKEAPDSVMKVLELNTALEAYRQQLETQHPQVLKKIEQLKTEMLNHMQQDVETARDRGELIDNAINLDHYSAYHALATIKDTLDFHADHGVIKSTAARLSTDLERQNGQTTSEQTRAPFMALQQQIAQNSAKLPQCLQAEITTQLETLRAYILDTPKASIADLKKHTAYKQLSEIGKYFDSTAEDGTAISSKIAAVIQRLENGLSRDQHLAKKLSTYVNDRIQEQTIPITSITSFAALKTYNHAFATLKAIASHDAPGERSELSQQVQVALASIPERVTLLKDWLSTLAQKVFGRESPADTLSRTLAKDEYRSIKDQLQTNLDQLKEHYPAIREGLRLLSNNFLKEISQSIERDMNAVRIIDISKYDAFKKLKTINEHLALLNSDATPIEKGKSLKNLEALLSENCTKTGFFAWITNKIAPENKVLADAATACGAKALTSRAPRNTATEEESIIDQSASGTHSLSSRVISQQQRNATEVTSRITDADNDNGAYSKLAAPFYGNFGVTRFGADPSLQYPF